MMETDQTRTETTGDQTQSHTGENTFKDEQVLRELLN